MTVLSLSGVTAAVAFSTGIAAARGFSHSPAPARRVSVAMMLALALE